ncbi:helix-turn-helix transcriptional regulator [Paraburkholderia sp. EG286A]|uniref:helix-turn-helix transcriptional regulator n=1 Tax=Paraburkholderia sp. EG286A TaxID=3237014 RepID=UPI0034D1A458
MNTQFIGQYFTIPETAQRARVSVAHLHNLWAAGKGPARTRIGRRVFVTEEALRAWVASMTEPADREVA